MKRLLTGGAGYIGGVVAAQLAAAGHSVTVPDDLRICPRFVADVWTFLRTRTP